MKFLQSAYDSWSDLSTTELPMLAREMIFDRPVAGARPMPSHAPDFPDDGGDPVTAAGWARLYGMLLSYESAIDAAGFETEADMRAPSSPRMVLHTLVDDRGTISFSHGGADCQLTAAEIRAHFARTTEPDGVGELSEDIGGPEV